MANQNGFGFLELFVFVCLIGAAGALSYKQYGKSSVEDVKTRQENVRLKELLKNNKILLKELSEEIKRLDVKTDNQQFRFNTMREGLDKDINYHKQLLASLEVEQGKLGNRITGMGNSINHTVPQLIAVKISQMEKPLEVRLVNKLQKTYSKSVERWKRRNYGWEKEIVTKTIPYKTRKKQTPVNPDQMEKLKGSIGETKTAMQEAGL